MKLGTTFSVILWLIIVLLSLLWNIRQSNLQYRELALYSARSFHEQLLLTREWGARHGGVYVPATKDTQPNQYLDVPARDLAISDKLQLTMINPSYMLRQISELAERQQGMKFRITSLSPIRPENKPSDWEKKALLKFTTGTKEVSEFSVVNDITTFLYMAPLVAAKPCLTCHTKAKRGEVLGGISIQLPFFNNDTNIFIYLGHFFMAVVGMVGVILFWAMLGREYRRIHHQAVVDSLTGIANRRSFDMKIEEEFNRSMRNKEPLSLLMCDIDHFKQYNDNYGHASGDTCLTRVAQSIKGSVKRPADFCARYGGEEFVIILPETALSGAQQVAEKILDDIRQLNLPHLKSSEGKVTLSLGIAMHFDNSPESFETLIKQADSALYLAKQNGRNRLEIYKNEDLAQP